MKVIGGEGDLNFSPEREGWVDRLPAAAKRILEEDSEYFVAQALSTPCLNAIQGAKGVYLEDVNGRQIIDFHGNNVHQVGYANPEILAAAWQQMQALPFCPRRYTNSAATALARKLNQLSPIPRSKVLLARGAAEAMAMAQKVVRLATGRWKTVSFYGSFHGATLDTLSLGGQPEMTSGLGPLLEGALHLPPFDPKNCRARCSGSCDFTCLEYLDNVLAQEGDVGALIVEPIRNTDVRIPPQGYFQRAQEICRRHGCLLVVDETAIAWGRTGKMFAIEHYPGVEPDMMVLGKGLGAGLFPISALLVNPTLDVVAASSVGHFTFEKSPVGAVVALAMIDVLERTSLVEKAERKGAFLRGRLERLAEQHLLLGAIRQVGLLIGFEIRRPSGEGWPEAAEALLYASLLRGLNFKVAQGFICLWTPPLIIGYGEFDTALRILDEAMAEVERELLAEEEEWTPSC